MIIKDRSYPHPVLTPFRDDVHPNDFSLKLSVMPDADNYYLDVEFVYSNPTITNMVESERAVHCIHIECRRNYYREIFTSRAKTARLTIPATEMVGRVEVSGFVKASKTLSTYSIEGAHADYGDTTFHLQDGDPLAVAETYIFDAYVDYDPLKTVKSILNIRCSEEVVEGPMKIDTGDDNQIIVTLSKQDYRRYTDLKGNPSLGPLLANQVVVPAILEAVVEIRKTSEDEIELEMRKKWFRSITKKLEDSKIDPRSSEVSAFDAVQTILRLPLRRSLEGLYRLDPLDDAEQ
jgi:hypothetical protein